METGLNEISKRLQTSLNQTHESIKNQQDVKPEVLKQIVQDIGALKEKSTTAAQVHIPNIEQAIDSLTAIELMIEKMKEKETDNLVQSIRKAIMGELEEGARGMVSNIQIPYEFFHEQKVDLKKFLRAKQKVEKVYKPKT